MDQPPPAMPHGDDTPPAPDGRRRYTIEVPHAPQYTMIYDLPTSPEFLFQEEELRRNRTWGENLTFYTGVGFLAGSVYGGAQGLRRSVREAERGESAKLRVNRALNQCGSVGRKTGNRLGVIGMLFAGTESAVRELRDGADDWVNTVAAGVGAGVLHNMASGPRSAAVCGVVGGILAGASIAGMPVLQRFAPNLATRLENLY